MRSPSRSVGSPLGLLLEPRFKKVGPFYLWGQFPLFDPVLDGFKKKEAWSSTQQAERAKIPNAISEALAMAVEQFS